MLNSGDVEIHGKTMDHAKGMWAGQRPCWWTATHVATGVSVSWSDCCDVEQHKARDAALASLDFLIEAIGAQCPPIAINDTEAGE